MFLLYHSEGCNICELVLHECYVNDLYTTTCSGMLGHHSWYLTRVNSTNVLDEGLRIGEIGRRMNSKVKSVKQGVYRK
jgi:hypothetical protein